MHAGGLLPIVQGVIFHANVLASYIIMPTQGFCCRHCDIMHTRAGHLSRRIHCENMLMAQLASTMGDTSRNMLMVQLVSTMGLVFASVSKSTMGLVFTDVW